MLAFLLGRDLEQQPMSMAFQGESPTTHSRRKPREAEPVSPHRELGSTQAQQGQSAFL